MAADRPHCVLLEVTLEGGTSEALLREACLTQIPFIVFTGYARTEIPHEFAAGAFVQKPASFGVLVGSIMQVLTRRH